MPLGGAPPGACPHLPSRYATVVLPHVLFCPIFPTVRTSLLLSDDVCRRCNLACDRLFTLVVKFLQAPFWRPCTLAPRDICTPLPPLRYASGPHPEHHVFFYLEMILIRVTMQHKFICVRVCRKLQTGGG